MLLAQLGDEGQAASAVGSAEAFGVGWAATDGPTAGVELQAVPMSAPDKITQLKKIRIFESRGVA